MDALESSPAAAHTRPMEHVNKCVAALRSLVHAGESNDIPLAHKAIDEMLATAPADQHKASLDHVRAAVEEHRATASGTHQLVIADAVNDYIERLMTRFE
jgi:hypothetical protein